MQTHSPQLHYNPGWLHYDGAIRIFNCYGVKGTIVLDDLRSFAIESEIKTITQTPGTQSIRTSREW